jgi:hypothetical protein
MTNFSSLIELTKFSTLFVFTLKMETVEPTYQTMGAIIQKATT